MPRPSKQITKDISNFPFETIYEAYASSYNEYRDARLLSYNKYIASKEKEWSDTHEAPYEGNYSEEHPYSEPTIKESRAAGFRDIAATLTALGTKAAGSWLLPQLLSYLNTIKLVKNTAGLYDARATVLAWIALDKPRHLGMLHLITFPTRSAMVGTQTQVGLRDYCTLVPLFLAAFKKYRNVMYSEWDPASLELVVHEPLLTAMLADVPDATTEELLALREEGKIASVKHKLSAQAVSASPLNGQPDLVIVMKTQIWVAEPAVRTNLMVLDPQNWDNKPTSLISTDLFDAWDTKVDAQETMPWN